MSGPLMTVLRDLWQVRWVILGYVVVGTAIGLLFGEWILGVGIMLGAVLGRVARTGYESVRRRRESDRQGDDLG